MIPPDANAAFVAYHGRRPGSLSATASIRSARSVCLDETSKQLIIDIARADPRQTWNQPARHDYEYERSGVANLFMVDTRRWKAGGMS